MKTVTCLECSEEYLTDDEGALHLCPSCREYNGMDGATDTGAIR